MLVISSQLILSYQKAMLPHNLIGGFAYTYRMGVKLFHLLAAYEGYALNMHELFTSSKNCYTI
jgi:hypothetical protein